MIKGKQKKKKVHESKSKGASRCLSFRNYCEKEGQIRHPEWCARTGHTNQITSVHLPLTSPMLVVRWVHGKQWEVRVMGSQTCEYWKSISRELRIAIHLQISEYLELAKSKLANMEGYAYCLFSYLIPIHFKVNSSFLCI